MLHVKLKVSFSHSVQPLQLHRRGLGQIELRVEIVSAGLRVFLQGHVCHSPWLALNLLWRKKKKWLDDTGKWQVPFKIRCNKSAIHQAARYLPFFRCTDHIFSYHPDSISYCQSRWADFSPVSPSTCCGMAPSLRHCSVGAVVAGAADGADVSVNARHVCRDAAFLHPPTHCLLRHTACLLLSDALRLPAKVNCCWLLLRGNIGLHILTERLKQAHSDMSKER